MTEDEKPATKRVSNSEIQCFKRCRRKWWLSYYRRLEPIEKSPTGALKLGNRIHDSLEAYYSPEVIDPVDVLRKGYEEAIDAVPEEKYYQIEELNKEASLALAMIEGYVEWVAETGIDDDYEIIAVEDELSYDLDYIPVTIMGKLDTRIRRRSDGKLLSMDHKTCASFETVTRALELNEQPMMYQMLERLSQPDGEHVVGGVYNMLRKVKRTGSAKPPFYLREQIYHNDEELRSYWKKLVGILTTMYDVVQRLDEGQDHHTVVYPTPQSTCAWDCEFRAVCPLFDDGSRAEAMVDSLYQVHNPYDRYQKETTL